MTVHYRYMLLFCKLLSEETKSNLEHVVMIAYKYPITDHLGPGPSVASILRDDASCLVKSKSNGKTGFYFIKVTPPVDEPDPKGSCLNIVPSPFFVSVCAIALFCFSLRSSLCVEMV